MIEKKSKFDIELKSDQEWFEFKKHLQYEGLNHNLERLQNDTISESLQSLADNFSSSKFSENLSFEIPSDFSYTPPDEKCLQPSEFVHPEVFTFNDQSVANPIDLDELVCLKGRKIRTKVTNQFDNINPDSFLPKPVSKIDDNEDACSKFLPSNQLYYLEKNIARKSHKFSKIDKLN